MKTAANIQKVALLLFIVVGLAHILSGLMLSNQFFMPQSLWVNRVLDIPFAMLALAYGFTSIYQGIAEENQKKAGIAFAVIGVLIFGILLYINLLVPDKPSILTTVT